MSCEVWHASCLSVNYQCAYHLQKKVIDMKQIRNRVQFSFLNGYRIYMNLCLSAMLLSVVSSCSSNSKVGAQLKVSPLQPKTGEYPECGIRGYRQVADANLCGVVHQAIADSACSILGYVGQDIACGWARGPQTGTSGNGSEEAHCPSDEWTRVSGGGACHGHDLSFCNEITCRFHGELATCTHQNPAHGSPVYDTCRAASHPIESVLTCDDHNQPIYNSCQLYATTEEIPVRLQNLRDTISLVGPSLVKWRGVYETLKGTEQSSACFIKNYIGNPAYEEMISALKLQYLSSFGRTWSVEICTTGAGSGLVEVVKCDDAAVTQFCTASRAYYSIFNELTSITTNLTVLENDVVAQRDGAVRAEILALKKQAIGCQSLDSSICTAASSHP
jgi:hypothetical protein